MKNLFLLVAIATFFGFASSAEACKKINACVCDKVEDCCVKKCDCCVKKCDCCVKKCDCCVTKCDCCRSSIAERIAEKRAERACSRAERAADRRCKRVCQPVCCASNLEESTDLPNSENSTACCGN